MNCAPEIYNRIIQQTLDSCEGVRSIFDDIIVYGTSVEEHDKRLYEVVKTLSEKGLTLNHDKCIFRMEEVKFMGHILSKHGIGLAQDKVKAVEARRPNTAGEVRSFMGLITFCAKFVPNLASISEPLRRLTRKNEQFKWGLEQEGGSTCHVFLFASLVKS